MFGQYILQLEVSTAQENASNIIIFSYVFVIYRFSAGQANIMGVLGKIIKNGTVIFVLCGVDKLQCINK